MAAAHCRPLRFKDIPKLTVARRKIKTAIMAKIHDTTELKSNDLKSGDPNPHIDATTTRIP